MDGQAALKARSTGIIHDLTTTKMGSPHKDRATLLLARDLTPNLPTNNALTADLDPAEAISLYCKGGPCGRP